MADEELKRYRDEIDRLDEELLRVLNLRARCALRIGEIKKEKSLPLYIPHREQEVLDRLEEGLKAIPGVGSVELESLTRLL